MKTDFITKCGDWRAHFVPLGTTLCLVEQSLNARPITAVSSDPLDLEALTPNHFILGQHAASFLSLSFEENFDHKKRFARAQSYANAIWTRWMREYVPSLNRRAKWHNQSHVKLKAGDLVWVKETDTPRGHYPLAPFIVNPLWFFRPTLISGWCVP